MNVDAGDRIDMAAWVHSLAPWQVISHLTFRWEASLESGRRCYEKFMRRHLARVSYFYALEENPCRDGFHVHSLWADAGSVFRREAWAAWFKRYGRARIEPVRSKGDVSDYCSKYVTKEGAWWNVKLQWHRLQEVQGAGFSLERDPVVDTGTQLPVPSPLSGHCVRGGEKLLGLSLADSAAAIAQVHSQGGTGLRAEEVGTANGRERPGLRSGV